MVAKTGETEGDCVWGYCALIHGSLHLLGYDHLDDEQAQDMEMLEKQVMTACGFDDPYADRDA